MNHGRVIEYLTILTLLVQSAARLSSIEILRGIEERLFVVGSVNQKILVENTTSYPIGGDHMMSKAVAYLVSVAHIIMDNRIPIEEEEGFLRLIRQHFDEKWAL